MPKRGLGELSREDSENFDMNLLPSALRSYGIQSDGSRVHTRQGATSLAAHKGTTGMPPTPNTCRKRRGIYQGARRETLPNTVESCNMHNHATRAKNHNTDSTNRYTDRNTPDSAAPRVPIPASSRTVLSPRPSTAVHREYTGTDRWASPLH